MEYETNLIGNQVWTCDNRLKLDNRIMNELNFNFVRMKRNWDCIIVVDGAEGCGKTTFSIMLCSYVNYLINKHTRNRRKFGIDNIVFTNDQFTYAVKNLPEFNCILWDEAMLSLSTGDAITGMQSTLRKLFTTIRKKRMFIVLVIPYVFQLQRYFASSRAQLLFHLYSPDNMKRGYWSLYSKMKLKQLYMLGKRNNDSYIVHGEISGRFTNPKEPLIDWESYDMKKETTIQQIGEQQEENNKSSFEIKSYQAKQRNMLMWYLFKQVNPKKKSEFARWFKDHIPMIRTNTSKLYEFAMLGKQLEEDEKDGRRETERKGKEEERKETKTEM